MFSLLVYFDTVSSKVKVMSQLIVSRQNVAKVIGLTLNESFLDVLDITFIGVFLL